MQVGLFQDSDFAGVLEHQVDSYAFSEVTHTFVPISWMCKKQTSVSHSSTESEIISPDAGLRMDGIFALDLLDLVIEVLHASSKQPKKSKENVQGNLLHDTPSRKHTKNQVKTPIQHNDLELCNVDYVSANVKSSQSGAMLHIVEDNEAAIKMIYQRQKSNNETRIQIWTGCLIESIWIQRFKSNMSTSKTNWQTN